MTDKIHIDSVIISDKYSDMSVDSAIKMLQEVKKDKKSFMIFGGIIDEEKEDNMKVMGIGIGTLKAHHKNPIGSVTLKSLALLFEK